MAVKVIRKGEPASNPASPTSQNLLKPIPVIIPPKPARANIIIRAIRIMLMDIRIRLYPQKTREDLEKYSQFSDLVYGRK